MAGNCLREDWLAAVLGPQDALPRPRPDPSVSGVCSCATVDRSDGGGVDIDAHWVPLLQKAAQLVDVSTVTSPSVLVPQVAARTPVGKADEEELYSQRPELSYFCCQVAEAQENREGSFFCRVKRKR